MNAEEKAKVLEKLRKLMALAERAGTEEEADAANRRVHALLSRYNLDITQILEANTDDEAVIDQELATERYNERWRRMLMHGAASLYFCSYLYSDAHLHGVNSQRAQRGVNHHFIGRPHNIAVAKMMGQYLVQTVNRLANEAARTSLVERLGGRNPTSTERGRFVNSFRLAAASRLHARLLEMKKQAEEGTAQDEEGKNLPALRSLYQQEEDLAKSWIEKNIGDIRQKTSRARITDRHGATLGYHAGNSVGLNTQIADSSRKMSLPNPGHLLSDQRGNKNE